ncbi:P-loop containing nucleoside triphosphate hydrolase [Sesbania bispinosa]|nr:P-loop containing nucleoside triphosphate hydrolase [Sesbania bispinosa]
MGRRNSSLQQTLRRRVEAMCPTADEIVNNLRSTYSDYQRTKQQTLKRFVQEALQSTRNHGDEDEDRNPSRKRRKEIDEGDKERLQNMEASMQVPSTPSYSTSESGEEDGTASVSSVEPCLDLMKTMLRNSYTATKVVVEGKNVEMEVSNSGKAINTVNEGEAKSAGRQLKGSVSNGGGDDDVEVKGKDGPRFRYLGGMKEVLEEVKREVILPFYHPHVPRDLKPSGILLHGPSGCGKTILARAIANETGLPFYQMESGALEENIRQIFYKAYRTTPSIVFIDEIDAVASKRENLQRDRIVTKLITCMDQPPDDLEGPSGSILVIGATSRPDAIDPALRRRFDREIIIGIPDESAREDILSKLITRNNLKFEGPIDLQKIARATPGFVGADLVALTKQASNLAMNKIVDERYVTSEPPEDWCIEPWLTEEVDKHAIKMSDFEEAVKRVQPSTKREGFSSIPNVKWEDVGGLDHLRQEFEDYIIRRIKYPEDYERFGVKSEAGILLYGPPGCGKTLIAKAVANAAGANFRHIKGPELLNKYVGESELEVRKLFSHARTCAPCILFFDEVDALATKRGKEGGWVTERLLNQLLIELDGAEQRRGVFVIGATNRPEVMDPALLRPGRLGKLLYVPLPSPDERVLILKALARTIPVDASVDLNAIGTSEACDNLSGADLAALMNEAALAAIRERRASTDTTRDTLNTVKTHHIHEALSKVFPSVSDMQKQYYQHLSERFNPAFRRSVKERSEKETGGNQSFGGEWKRGRKEKKRCGTQQQIFSSPEARKRKLGRRQP